ncbi:hypothetical protein [Mesorhizobium sp. CN2-181]|uniref:DUF5983 family protein n=1 Tax=Mesorhizobium yinganensis TaxID=3157707 RepID=UPI0032B79414
MIRQFLDLSTGHVSLDTRDWLDAQGKLAANFLHFEDKSPVISTIGRTCHGWFIWAGDKEDDNWSADHLARGVPEDLIAVLTYARNQGCDYVLFDQDADRIDGLPYFEW